MKPLLHRVLALGLALGSLAGQPAAEPVDFNKARQLIERQRAGERLSAEERAYLERARAEREKQQRGSGKTAPAAGRLPQQRPMPSHLTPLTDLGAEGKYEGEDGGLYGGGRNIPPEAHRQAAEKQLALVRPLDAAGRPAADGLIGLVALSMSNATQEFSRFKQVADASPLKSPRVAIVDCAQGGQAMAEWAPADAKPWQVARDRLAAARVSLQQVQVIWVKLANKGPTGSLAEHGRKLERDTLALLQHARALFPNLRLAYLGSRTYGGYAVTGLNPEPYAYESAFPARWLIQRQIKGDPALALDRAPLLLWGPYLWADGTRGRQIDSLVWQRADFVADGVHPSDSGRQKVAELLLAFLSTDPLAKSWFARL
jgi:lysophospholipase L1-like esterase